MYHPPGELIGAESSDRSIRVVVVVVVIVVVVVMDW